ncbi:hypothetical protein CVE29_26860 [Pseudomonas syringae pv. actinidiae]|nr:hypothetical protein [Pseudomonas syringae pv. actinidiae]
MPSVRVSRYLRTSAQRFTDLLSARGYRADAPRRMPFWTLCVLFVKLCVTQRFCGVGSMCFRLKSPFRPSATTLMGPK